MLGSEESWALARRGGAQLQMSDDPCLFSLLVLLLSLSGLGRFLHWLWRETCFPSHIFGSERFPGVFSPPLLHPLFLNKLVRKNALTSLYFLAHPKAEVVAGDILDGWMDVFAYCGLWLSYCCVMAGGDPQFGCTLLRCARRSMRIRAPPLPVWLALAPSGTLNLINFLPISQNSLKMALTLISPELKKSLFEVKKRAHPQKFC